MIDTTDYSLHTHNCASREPSPNGGWWPCNCDGPEVMDKLVEDAARWNAFLNSERIRFFGTAGPHGDYAHFGAEFWTVVLPDGANSETTKRNREFLITYADTARLAQKR
jgi:hypothetical protein